VRLVTLDEGRDGAAGAVLDDGSVLHLGRAALPNTIEAWLPGDLSQMLAGGAEGLAVARRIVARAQDESATELQRLRERRALFPAESRLLAPLPRPRLVLAAGLAYKSHLAEMAGTPQPPHPTAFMKSPHSIVGTDMPVRLPPGAAEHVDYEGEVALVFGRECHAVAEHEAMEFIAGYTAANDLSARDWVKEVWAAERPWDARRTWEVNIMGKQFPGFTGLGPTLLTADAVPDPTALEITTRINGRTVQQALLSDLIFPLARTVAWLSRWYTFAPGDVLLTGTPAGVGVGRKPPLFLRAGDTVEVSLSGGGTLRNRIVD
jgi:acylpyruvate hydrolase